MHAQLSDSPPQKVTLKTWGGRDVNVTSKMARQLLEAEVLTGLVKNLKVRPTPTSLSLSSLPRLSFLPSSVLVVRPSPTSDGCFLRGPMANQPCTCLLTSCLAVPVHQGKNLVPDLVSAPAMAKEAGIEAAISQVPEPFLCPLPRPRC